MGPAYLLDVVGIDTAHHAQAVMAAGFPERMNKDYRDAVDVMFDNQRFGQKNGQGFTAIRKMQRVSHVKKMTNKWINYWQKSANLSKNSAMKTLLPAP